MRERGEREGEREVGRESDREREREVGRESDRERERETGRERDRERERERPTLMCSVEVFRLCSYISNCHIRRQSYICSWFPVNQSTWGLVHVVGLPS